MPVCVSLGTLGACIPTPHSPFEKYIVGIFVRGVFFGRQHKCIDTTRSQVDRREACVSLGMDSCDDKSTVQ